jgi:hypothetical protein
MQRDSEDADAPGGVVYHGQYIGLGAVEKVGREEVARQDRLRLRPQKLRPGGSGSGRGFCGNPIRGSRGPAGGSVPGCSDGWPGGRSCRAWTWRPSGGGRCRGASAGSCPGRPAAAVRGAALSVSRRAGSRAVPCPPSSASGGAAAAAARQRADGAGAGSLRSSTPPPAGTAATTRLTAWSG